jgi:hypothetical protein
MMKRTLGGLVVLVCLTASCKDEESQRKIAELQAEIGALQKQQQEAASKKAADTIADSELAALGGQAPPADFAGTWNLTYKANYSTCTEVAHVGDVRAATLQVSLAKEELRATETTPGNTPHELSGETNGRSVLFLSKGENGTQVGLEFQPNGKGRRVVTNPGCAIIYDVTGKKVQ